MANDTFGNGLVAEGSPLYLEWARRGYIYTARTAAAAVIPVDTTFTNAPTLWNTASSGKLVVPISVTMSAVSPGTILTSGFSLGTKGQCGDGVGTAAPIVTFTNAAPVSTILGSQKTSVTKFAPAVVTFTGAPTPFMDTGLGWNMSSAVGENGMTFQFYFNGSVIVPPGAILTIGSPTAVTVATFWTTYVFAEIPIPAGFFV